MATILDILQRKTHVELGSVSRYVAEVVNTFGTHQKPKLLRDFVTTRQVLRRSLVIAGLIIFAPVSVLNAQRFTWQGDAGDQSWQDEQNWTGATGVPNSSGANVWFDEVSTAGGGPLNIDFESATAVQLDSIQTNESTAPVTVRNSFDGPIEVYGTNDPRLVSNDILTNNGGESLTIDADIQLFNSYVWINSGLDSGRVTINGNIAPNDERAGLRVLSITGRNYAADQGIVINGIIADGPNDSEGRHDQVRVDTGWAGDGANHTNLIQLTGQNTFTGGIHVRTNTLEFDSIADKGLPSPLGAGTNPINLGAGNFVGTVRYTGNGHSTNRNFHLFSGGQAGGAIEASGDGPLTLRGDLTSTFGGNKQWRLGGTSSGIITGAVHDQIISGDVRIYKDGIGTWTLAGANVYEGATAVAQGELVLTGSIGSENLVADKIEIREAATLTIDGGNATVSDLDNLGGTLNLRSGSLLLKNNNESGGAGSLTIGTHGAGLLGLHGGSQRFDDVILSGSDDTLELVAGSRYFFRNLDNSAGGTIVTSSPTIVIDGTFTNMVPAGQESFLRAQVAGEGGLTKRGDGTLTVLSLNYTGETRVEDGTLMMVGPFGVSNQSSVFVAEGANLETAGADNHIGALAGSGTVQTRAGSLSITNVAGDHTFAGAILGEGSLEKVGNGTQELAGRNTYSGDTDVLAGTLRITGTVEGTRWVHFNNSTIEIDGGTLDTTGNVAAGKVGAELRLLNGGLLKANHIERSFWSVQNEFDWVDGTVHLLSAIELNGSEVTRQAIPDRPFGASLTLDSNRHLIVDTNLSIMAGGSLRLEGGSVTAEEIVVTNRGRMIVDSGEINGSVESFGGEISVNGTAEFGDYRGFGSFTGDGTSMFKSDFEPDSELAFEGNIVFADTSNLLFGNLEEAQVVVAGSATLGGTLDISFPKLPEGYIPGEDATYTLLESSDLSGSFENVHAGGRLSVENGSFLVSYGDGSEFDANNVVLSNFLVGLLGDFDHNGVLDAGDINLLTANIGGADSMFDLTSDALITEADREFWVTDLRGTFFGDADLDGNVDFADFLTMSANFGLPGGWEYGDFNGSGLIDFQDFLQLSSNFGQSEELSAVAVPEPNANLLLYLGLILPLIRMRWSSNDLRCVSAL